MLENMEIPSSVENLEEEAFENCNRLRFVSIGSKLENIKDSAFLNCTSLEEVMLTNNSSLRVVSSTAFTNCSDSLKIILRDNLKREDKIRIFNGFGYWVEVHHFEATDLNICESLEECELNYAEEQSTNKRLVDSVQTDEDLDAEIDEFVVIEDKNSISECGKPGF